MYGDCQVYTFPFIPRKGEEYEEVEGELTEEQVYELIELQATVFLNMAVCHYMLKEYDECCQKATESIHLQPTIKAFYRRA